MLLARPPGSRATKPAQAGSEFKLSIGCPAKALSFYLDDTPNCIGWHEIGRRTLLTNDECLPADASELFSLAILVQIESLLPVRNGIRPQVRRKPGILCVESVMIALMASITLRSQPLALKRNLPSVDSPLLGVTQLVSGLWPRCSCLGILLPVGGTRYIVLLPLLVQSPFADS